MLSILELYDLVACRYLNYYSVYIDLLNDRDSDALELRDT